MKKQEPKYIRRLNQFGMGITIVSIVGAIYIMIHKLGLIESLDFGAGSYFYADIPNFQKYVNSSHYDSTASMGELILLFLLWGVMMYRLWVWVDKKFH